MKKVIKIIKWTGVIIGIIASLWLLILGFLSLILKPLE